MYELLSRTAEEGRKHLSKCAVKYSLTVNNPKLQTLLFNIARAHNNPEKVLNEYASFVLKDASLIDTHPLYSSLSKLYNPKYALSKDLHKQMVDKILQGKGDGYIDWIILTKGAEQSIVQIVAILPDCLGEDGKSANLSTTIFEKLAQHIYCSSDNFGKKYPVAILRGIREGLEKLSKKPSNVYLNNLSGLLLALTEQGRNSSWVGSLDLKKESDKLQKKIDSYSMD